MDRFILLIAPTMDELTELLNTQTESYFTIFNIYPIGKSFGALLDRMPVELVIKIDSSRDDSAYESPEMA